jgi:hypothetical protein
MQWTGKKSNGHYRQTDDIDEEHGREQPGEGDAVVVPRKFHRDSLLACMYSVPWYLQKKCKHMYVKRASDTSRLQERLLTTNHGDKPELRFPMYYSMNLRRNVDYLELHLGLEFRHLNESEVPYWDSVSGTNAAFHVRLPPSSVKQGLSMPLLSIGDTLQLTQVRTGVKQSMLVDNYDAAPCSSSSFSSNHGIVWGIWTHEVF